MKNLFKITLIVSLLLTSVFAQAAEVNFLLKVKAGREKSVVFVNEKTQRLSLTVSGANEGILYQNSMDVYAGASTTYDLTAFPNGEYSFKLETATDLTTYNVVIANGKVQLGEPVVKTFFKPTLLSKDGLVTLSLDDKNYGDLALEIYNSNNEKLYEDVFEGKAKLKKTFSIDKANGRELTFIVKSADQHFTQKVSIY